MPEMTTRLPDEFPEFGTKIESLDTLALVEDINEDTITYVLNGSVHVGSVTSVGSVEDLRLVSEWHNLSEGSINPLVFLTSSYPSAGSFTRLFGTLSENHYELKKRDKSSYEVDEADFKQKLNIRRYLLADSPVAVYAGANEETVKRAEREMCANLPDKVREKVFDE